MAGQRRFPRQLVPQMGRGFAILAGLLTRVWERFVRRPKFALVPVPVRRVPRQNPRRVSRLGRRLLVFLWGILWIGMSSLGSAFAPFGQEASWSSPSYSEARQRVRAWIDELQQVKELDETVVARLAELWPEDEERSEPEVELLDRLAKTLETLEPQTATLIELTRGTRPRGILPSFDLVADETIAAPVRVHLRLILGRWLVQQEMYDEALDKFGELEAREVLAPATLLFCQSVAHHKLLQKDACLPKLAKLLENEAKLPRRYRELTRLMEADITPLKDDSLDEIARIMDNVTRRLNLGRAGQRVRSEEDDVVAKLDKMIEQLEQQQQQQQQQSGGGAQGQAQRAPNRPMDDSRAAGGSGPGNVTPRNIGRSSGWGNLPPREREEAMQEITKNLPAHYRDVIEEYFRKLARTSD